MAREVQSSIHKHDKCTHKLWSFIFLYSCCSYSQLRNSTLERLGVTNPRAASYYHGTTHEPRDEDILAWRVYLRTKKYLEPIANSTTRFTSLSGVELSESLLNMNEIGNTRRKMNMGALDHAEEVAPIFVTDEERSEYLELTNKKLPKDKLVERVDTLLSHISNDDARVHLQDEWATVRNKNKSEVWQFHQQISEIVSLQPPDGPDPIDDMQVLDE